MNKTEIYKRLYKDYSKKYFDKIVLSALFSIVVAGSTSAIAWLLDPAIKKLFIEKDQSLIILIPLMIILAFTSKGLSLYFAKATMISVGEEIKKKLQFDMVKSLIKTDTQIIDKKHSGKFISNLINSFQRFANVNRIINSHVFTKLEVSNYFDNNDTFSQYISKNTWKKNWKSCYRSSRKIRFFNYLPCRAF